uniref:Placental growth factor n=1 Tax=Nothobranchius furzeri TaxID=105023 RepID=A0A1A7ZRZ1_NOTFU
MKASYVIQTAVAIYLLLSPVQNVPVSRTNSTSEVLMFQEVWGRSFCRTIEKLVEVVQEYPTEVEHIYSPSCVPLVRCAGCCGDEKLECHPTQTTNVTMQLLKIRPSKPGNFSSNLVLQYGRPFPAQHKESLPLIYQDCVCDQKLKQLG